jgi:hypothetical protein
MGEEQTLSTGRRVACSTRSKVMDTELRLEKIGKEERK